MGIIGYEIGLENYLEYVSTFHCRKHETSIYTAIKGTHNASLIPVLVRYLFTR